MKKLTIRESFLFLLLVLCFLIKMFYSGYYVLSFSLTCIILFLYIIEEYRTKKIRNIQLKWYL